jgi:polygalacturonase
MSFRKLMLLLLLLVCIIQPVFPSENRRDYSAEVIVGKKATHIARISNDTIVVIEGGTYLYTVDTPEDQGLVSTRPSTSELLQELSAKDGSTQQYKIMSQQGVEKKDEIITGDRLSVISQDGKSKKTYIIVLRQMALSGQLRLEREAITVNTTNSITLFFSVGQRSPDATININIPGGVDVMLDNTTANVIGRGDVKLKDLDTQSIGRVGTKYSYSKVGTVAIAKSADGSTLITFSHLDLRPSNGPDLVFKIENVKLKKTGTYHFRANYSTSKPDVLSSAGTGLETATLNVVQTIADLKRDLEKSLPYRETATTFKQIAFSWSTNNKPASIQLMQSLDDGKTWKTSPAAIEKNTATVTGLIPDKLYTFRLSVKDGEHKGYSNTVKFYSGKMDIKSFGVTGKENQDDTDKINDAIGYISQLGGGTLLFSAGIYNVRTVHLKSNVYLYVDKGAIITALKGADAPESTWFSDRKYRSGLSPTDRGPYEDPENYLTKQDVGHHYFRNTMFFGERIDNVKIIGNGLITGNGNLVTGDRVMNNTADNRADKMFTFKLCTNIEIGGLYRTEDLWYDPDKDEPYYMAENGSKLFDVGSMLNIEQAGHFALLATGTDNLNVHDTYFGKNNTSNVRDIYDFMGCNDVVATNIYSKVSSDDVIKPGSDCSLGFTRPARNYKVRNIIGDTNCNLFQVGSETADDIQDIHVDNIYVLGANKAGFSISTNDGGYIKDIHLNCGHTGPIHSRSKMLRSFTPFFISISNRGRILGADVGHYNFTDNGEKHQELLVKNVNIGQVENIILNGIDIAEVYAGSSFGKNSTRWKAYDGTQRRATPIVAGYSLPDTDAVEGGLDFKLPNGKHTGYVTNVVFNDVHVLVKGGNPLSDTAMAPPELGVGQYNVSNLKVQPAYGFWARHVMGLALKNCTFNYEKHDGRYAIVLDDVANASISSVKMVRPGDNDFVIKLKNSPDIVIEDAIYYHDNWGNAPMELPRTVHRAAHGDAALPKKM